MDSYEQDCIRPIFRMRRETVIMAAVWPDLPLCFSSDEMERHPAGQYLTSSPSGNPRGMVISQPWNTYKKSTVSFIPSS